MGIRDWWNRKTSQQADDTVRYYDFDTRAVVTIPKSELAPGVIEVQIEGMDGLVWVDPEKLTPGPVQHAEFDEDVRDYIRQIQAAFEEHRDLSCEEWEEGFRRDTEPLREIALWSHAADVYTEFAATDTDPARRRDFYVCVVTCLTSTPDAVWQVLNLAVLPRDEAEKVISRFYGKDG